MSSPDHHHRTIQQRVVRSLLIVAAIVLAIAIPLVINDDLRYDLAMRFNLIPGQEAEQLTQPDDGSFLVVVPIEGTTGAGETRLFYRAQFIGRPAGGSTDLTEIDSGEVVTIPLREVDFIAADPTGAHVLMRGPDGGQAVLIDTGDLAVEELPEGEVAPDLPGDWETPVWASAAGLCDRFSPEKKFIACFKRADAASYLAGDWQIDIQLYGDYTVTEPVYRGQGFLLPMVGFAHDDRWLYFQSIDGIWRVEVPEDLQAMAP